jgi:hypothetical protein
MMKKDPKIFADVSIDPRRRVRTILTPSITLPIEHSRPLGHPHHYRTSSNSSLLFLPGLSS